ncbi:MAG: glycerol-3-phosphate dehydrogenase/oxidase [Flavobacteriales bacterium]|nr:glycerol-3-phosphate dehydrogenase/oxidase [Flavobacteriales bacterium]
MDARTRAEELDKASNLIFDTLIIGGGITGAGILLDASSRGLKSILLEMQDFAEGTSSRSTKLVHGGLRYLKQLQLGVVRKTGKERAILNKNAPYLIKKVDMMLPIYKGGSLKKIPTKIALYVYDRLAGVAKQEKYRFITKDEALEKQPCLPSKDLSGCFLYTEYQTDDARLVIEILKTSRTYGANAFNYCEVTSISKENGLFIVKCYDHINNKEYLIKSKSLVNATGPWTDKTMKLNLNDGTSRVVHSKGVHIVVDKNLLPLSTPVYFENTDSRMIFAIPRLDKVYIGTTDTLYNQDPKTPKIQDSDIDYLVNAINSFFRNHPITRNDILSSWAGVRPLIKGRSNNTQELSRKDEIFISTNGMITIAGGKLTGYRLMAKSVVDLLMKGFPGLNAICVSESIQLIGTNDSFNTTQEDWYFKYGASAASIQSEFQGSDIEKELRYCIRNEMCTNLSDFFVRRSGMSYFQPERIEESLKYCIKIFKEELGWDETLTQTELIRLRKDITV